MPPKKGKQQKKVPNNVPSTEEKQEAGETVEAEGAAEVAAEKGELVTEASGQGGEEEEITGNAQATKDTNNLNNPNPNNANDEDIMSQFATLEQAVGVTLANTAELKEMWSKLDFDNSGKVSILEMDKLVVRKWPLLNHFSALIRAYTRTTSREGGGEEGDWIEKKDMRAMLSNILIFNKLFAVFELENDTGDDRRVNLAEFQGVLSRLGLKYIVFVFIFVIFVSPLLTADED